MREIIANPHAATEKGRGIKVAQFLLEYKADIIAAKEDLAGKGPGYALADAGAEIVKTSASTLDESEKELLLR